ncbi:hypothetical protein [Petrocella sp. FN5]|nr:hypothetical protein [Petrocella sp. FN5]MDF1615873.1 hypothetical protein [Petrocella sp. FN5]
MSEQCTDSCSTCSENCGDRVEKQKIHLENAKSLEKSFELKGNKNPSIIA